MAPERNTFNPLTIVGLTLSSVGMVGIGLAVAWLALRTPEVRPREEKPSVEIVRPYSVPPAPEGTGGPEADDGELHDARSLDVSYGFEDANWILSDTERVKAYGKKDVTCNFLVRYPQLTGRFEHLDEVNELLRACAMESVHTYYEDPSDETVERVKEVVGDGEIMLASEVSYAVSYNTEDFLSVMYSDVYYIGSEYAGFTQLRTVNVNLKTGETYELDDVLAVDDDIAGAFVDNLIAQTGTDDNADGRLSGDECFTVRLAGRRALMDALQGKGELAPRVNTCFFVDGNGKVNLGATYWVSGDDGFVRGWWDVTLTDEQVRAARRDSSFWELVE